MFKLFNGTFQSIESNGGEAQLKTTLKSFLPNYIESIKLDRSDLFTTLEGVHFLPVDKNIYLRIQCFINLTENTFPTIQYSAFVYRDHLVWSGLEQDDMRTLYKYIVQFLTPNLSETNTTISTFIPISKVQKGFITGNSDKEVPFVYIGKDEKLQLIICKLNEIICIFLLNPNSDNSTNNNNNNSMNNSNNTANSDTNFSKNLSSFIIQQLEYLSPILEDHYTKKHSFEEQYKYVYYNHMNFALKTSIKDKGVGLPRDTMKMLNDIHQDFEK